MAATDLQALLANLRPRSQASSISRDQSREPSSTFPLLSQIPSTPPPPFSPAPSTGRNDNPNSTPSAQNLLNLLNFGHAQPQSTNHSTVSAHNHTLSTSDLVSQPTGSSHDNTPNAAPPSRPTSTPPNPLLSLLHGSTNGLTQSSDDKGTSLPAESSPARNVPEPDTASPHPLQTQQSPKPIFTYTNPFDALKASRPHTPRTAPQTSQQPQPPPAADTPGEAVTPSDPPKAFQTYPERMKLTPKTRAVKSPVLPPPPEVSSDLQQDPVVNRNSSGLDDSQTSQPANEQTVPHAQKEASMAPTAALPIPDVQIPAGSADKLLQPPSQRVVPVLTFPIKAFVSITLEPRGPSEIEIRPDSVMEISRLKKDFDQIDRSLAVASSTYITYAFVKNGGMRVIRQQDGSDRSVFKNSHDRVFNVGLCTSAVNSPPSDHQAVLGTGVSGAVYYATISRTNNDLFEKNELEVESLVFPAYPPVDENTAGGVLKTRAKRSSRHPEYFAIGRGRNIQIVWPSTAISPRYGISSVKRVVDSETFFYERGLSISTGKAGKDFTFSEDDTVIVSLDKSGRLRFWDIRELVDASNALSSRPAAIEVDTPILSLATASAAEKSWPTSVLFVDKARPYTRGGALRYVLVGLRQNHTLQLWDIALGKAVQEINFPHEHENDGICSVNYHPGSGIITVGHPTRNSIFFIHLSAPRYTLSSNLDQAVYVQRVASKDPEIPKPESTACMSGIREITLGARGQLRSVELLPVHKPAAGDNATAEDKPLFELYVTHSRGVTCLAINKDDLGWDADNKVVSPIDAEKEGLVTLKDLKLGSVIEETALAASPVPDPSQQPSKSSNKKKKKVKELDESTNDKSINNAHDGPGASPVNLQPENGAIEPPVEAGPPKESKKNRRKALQAEMQGESLSDQSKGMSSDNMKSTPAVTPSASTKNPPQPVTSGARPEPVSMSISGDWLDKELKKIERGVASEFRKELDVLHQALRTERAAQEHAAATRQETVLRLVSESLTTNVEKSLSRILAAHIQQLVVPAVVQSVSSQLSAMVPSTIGESVASELRSSLPSAVHSAVQAPQFHNSINTTISERIASELHAGLSHALQHQIVPAVRDAVDQATVQATTRMAANYSDQFERLHKQREADAARIDSLNRALQGMATTLQTMSDTQVAFQEQILRERRSIKQQPEAVTMTQQYGGSVKSDPTSPQRDAPRPTAHESSRQDPEIDEIASLMSAQRYEEGSIKWLQSSQPVKLFDDLFVRFTPEYLATDVSPLVAFSIGVTVANSLATNIVQRLEWIAAAFDAVDLSDNEISELAPHAPQLLGSMITKLHAAYGERAQNSSDNVHMLIRTVLAKAIHLEAAFQRLNDNLEGKLDVSRAL